MLDRADDRLLVVVGPCSVHDVEAAREYAERLAARAAELRDDLCVAMRVYFEKPRTTTGWKGMITDPHLDGSGDVNAGVRHGARGCCSTCSSWACRSAWSGSTRSRRSTSPTPSPGARSAPAPSRARPTASSAPGCRCRSGFKNRTDGNVQVAVDAVRAAAVPHAFVGVDVSGSPAILHTRGNPDCHIILRGGRGAPNYGAERRRGRAGEAARGGAAGAARDRRLARQQPEGPRAPAGRGRGRGRPGGGGQRRDRRRDAGVVPGRRAPGPRGRRAAALRPVDHRRLHGLGHDLRGAGAAGDGGAGRRRSAEG